MKKDILSQHEDEFFSSLVIRYNQKEEKDLKEEEYIRERTKELVYRICKDKLMLKDDIISCLYISVNDDLDKIIRAYRISAKSFNHYLRQVCIYRIRRVREEIWRPEYLDIEYMRESEDSYYTLDDNIAVYCGEEIKSSMLFFNPRRYLEMDIKSLTEFITTTQNRKDYTPRSRSEWVLQSKLDNKYFRRNFLFFILSLPAGGSDEEAANYARVFQTDETAFTRLLFLKNEIIERNYPEREKNLGLAAMHWRMMAKLKNSMYKAQTEEEYKVLKDNYMVQVRCHHNRIKDAQRSLRGIIQSDIADTLGVCRTTVTMGIRKVKEELERINGTYSV